MRNTMSRKDLLKGVAMGAGLVALGVGASSRTVSAAVNNPAHPSWVYQRPIYNVNPAFWQEGDNDLQHVIDALPDLAALGIGMIQIMPLHPNDSTPYTPTDYMTIDDEYGNANNGVSGEQRLTQLVNAAHANDIKVILDVVPNHTGVTHPWVQSNPDYYKQEGGNPAHPEPNWSDAYQLNHQNQEVREHLYQSMEKWVSVCDVDGFRVDSAERVVNEPEFPQTAYPAFYEELRNRLWALKPGGVFLLAESSNTALHPDFDASYPWSVNADEWDSFDNLIKGKVSGIADNDGQTVTTQRVRDYISAEIAQYGGNVEVGPGSQAPLRIHYTHNHDKVNEDDHFISDYGGSAQYEVALMVTLALKGIPFLYTGQEKGSVEVGSLDEDYRLYWSEVSESAAWRGHLSTFFNLYRTHPALGRGTYHDFANARSGQVLSFGRKFASAAGTKTVIVVANLGGTGYSAGTVDVQIPAAFRLNSYRNLYGPETYDLAGKTLWSPSLTPYGYRIISK